MIVWLKLLCILDEYIRECLAIEVGKSLRNQDVILTLLRLIHIYGKPAFIRSDNGGEFTATAVMKWLRDQNVGPAYITLGSHDNLILTADRDAICILTSFHLRKKWLGFLSEGIEDGLLLGKQEYLDPKRILRSIVRRPHFRLHRLKHM
jgi:hypothetical protein